MSASIYYQPVHGKRLDIDASSSFLAALERAFGPPPWVLTMAHYNIMQGLAAGLASPDERAALTILMEAMVANETIRIWAEY